MAITRTLTELLAGARVVSNKDGDPAITDTQLTPLVNQEIRKLWALIGRLARDLVSAVSTSVLLTSGNTHTIGTGDGVTLANFMDLRGVEVTTDSINWLRIRPWSFSQRSVVRLLSYRLRGNIIEFLPVDQATTYRFRFRFLTMPTVLAAGGDTIDLPIGGDEYIENGVAVKIRARFKESARENMELQAAALATVRMFLGNHQQGENEPIPQADDDDWGMDY